MRLLGARVLVLLAAAPARADTLGELPFQPVAGVATCLRATGAPGEIARWTEDRIELMHADGAPWGCLTLLRDEGGAFSARDVDAVAELSAPLAEAVRENARPLARDHSARGPGVMVFDDDRELVSVNDDALAWLDELDRDHPGRTADGVPLPLIVLSTLVRGDGARVRARGASGRWLACHASRMRGAGGTAVVIEPAATSEILPIIAEAYDLSLRERQITQLIARGAATAEMAERLHLSPHTVRDYVKALFEKVGVSSRGELVAKLFTEHCAPIHYASGAHISAGSHA